MKKDFCDECGTELNDKNRYKNPLPLMKSECSEDLHTLSDATLCWEVSVKIESNRIDVLGDLCTACVKKIGTMALQER